jgi:hypothetical protein
MADKKKPRTAAQKAATRKLIAANKRARREEKKLQRAATGKAPRKANKKRKTTSGSREPQRTHFMTKKPTKRLALAVVAPLGKALGVTLFGRDGIDGAATLGAGTKMSTRFARGGNILTREIVGYWPGFRDGTSYKPGWQLGPVMENAGLMMVGYGVHKAAEKFGANDSLRKFGSPVVV